MGVHELAIVSGAGAAVAVPAAAVALTWLRIRRQGRTGAAPGADVIVVFAAAADPSGPSPELQARLRHAVDLFHGRHAATILCSGGHPGPDSEPRVMKRALVEAGVPEDAILIEETGSSTRRTLEAVERVGRGRWKRILVVSSPYHMYRIVTEAQRRGLPVVASPAPSTPIMKRFLPRFRQSAREVAAVWWYALTAPRRAGGRAARRAAPTVARSPAAAASAEAPELACVVLSLANEPGLVDAVRSLLAQEPAPELVVVNSGGGDAASTLRSAAIDVRVIDVPERLFPGAVRNLGVQATSAPYVAFLAADCLAEPGWVSGRLEAHRNGAAAVASALTVAPPQTLSAYASHLLLHHRRRFDAPLDDRVLAGLSYERAVLTTHGPFLEHVLVGEDTDYFERLDPSQVVAWTADVRTAHRYPQTLGGLLGDQLARGRIAGRSARMGDDRRPPRKIAARNIRNVVFALQRARAASDPEERRIMLATTPFLVLGGLACAIGVLTASRQGSRSPFRSS